MDICEDISSYGSKGGGVAQDGEYAGLPEDTVTGLNPEE